MSALPIIPKQDSVSVGQFTSTLIGFEADKLGVPTGEGRAVLPSGELAEYYVPDYLAMPIVGRSVWSIRIVFVRWTIIVPMGDFEASVAFAASIEESISSEVRGRRRL